MAQWHIPWQSWSRAWCSRRCSRWVLTNPAVDFGDLRGRKVTLLPWRGVASRGRLVLTVNALTLAGIPDCGPWMNGPILIDHSPPYATVNQPIGVSCPSVSLCVAVDQQGNVFTSTNPAGGLPAWSGPIDINQGGFMNAVSCPSVKLCVAVSDGSVLTSTNPAGGASAWSAPVSTHASNVLLAISCPSVSLCAWPTTCGRALGSVTVRPVARHLGLDAHRADSNEAERVRRARRRSPSGWLCVAVDSDGNVVTSTNPTGGTSAWKMANPDGTNFLTAVSCPTASECVAVDGSGNTLISTNPTGGAPPVEGGAKRQPQRPDRSALVRDGVAVPRRRRRRERPLLLHSDRRFFGLAQHAWTRRRQRLHRLGVPVGSAVRRDRRHRRRDQLHEPDRRDRRPGMWPT